jgi:hypothetical protein
MIFWTSQLKSQSFTRITSGIVVNDPARSFGSSWCDFDNDGDLDLFVANGGADGISALSFLYKNMLHETGNGEFVKITSGTIVNDSGISIGSTWADYDNDGFTDVFIANRNNQNNYLYRNDGTGGFIKITSGSIVSDGGNSNSSSWADIDNDGKPDMFVANFMQQRFLYKNEGAGNFTKITTGSIVTDVSNSISASWGDYNNDGKADLFVCNAGVPGPNNNLYVNWGGGTFSKVLTGEIVNDGGASMGSCWGDYDNDGDLDLFVANQADQNDFFYKNNGDSTFTKITADTVVKCGGSSISCSWVDADNDGDLDLFVTNWTGQRNFLFKNMLIETGNANFTRISSGDIVNDIGNSMGCSWGDYDNDGFADLFVCNRNNIGNFLYRNNGNSNKWINIKCIGVQSGKTALGSKVRIKSVINSQPIWQMREINAQSGYNSQNSMRAEFGLGNTTAVDSLVIQWSSGLREVYTDLSVNKFYVATEGQNIVIGMNKNPGNLPSGFTLHQNYPNPFNPATKIKFDIPLTPHSPLEGGQGGVTVRLVIYNVLGKEVAVLIPPLGGGQEGLKPGTYEVEWDASNYPSGVYYYRLETGGYSETRKMILLK